MRSISLSFIVCLVSFTSTILADYPEYDYSHEGSVPGGSPNASFHQPVVHPLKYEHWYRDFALQLNLISTTVCNLSLAAYRGDLTARETLGPVHDYCWTHADCILSTTSARVTTSFSETSILLGLAPTTLSVLGPSVAEIALLSLNRPLLSFLLSLGAPGVYPGRFLLWDDPLRANKPLTGAFIVRPFSRKLAILVSAIQYLVALACCGNILEAMWSIGVRSIVTWDCKHSYWPVLWVILSVIIHIAATTSLRAAIQRKKEFALRQEQNDSEPLDGGGNLKMTGIGALVHKEITPSANIIWQVSDLYLVKVGPLAVVLQYTGAFIAVCHLVFGTLLFSSLQFIGVSDAVTLILRMIASATFCRILLQFEVGGMIRVDDQRVYKGIVQAEETEKSK